MNRPITITVNQATLDHIRRCVEASGLSYESDEALAEEAMHLGLFDIARSYDKLADIADAKRQRSEERSEYMIEPQDWTGALDARQAS